MIIRLMIQSDLPELLTLWADTNLYLTETKREIHECNMMLKRNPTTCFVAEKDNKIIGSIFGASNGRRAWIYHFAVAPNFQKKGIGTILYNKTEQSLKKTGVTKIILAVAKDNLKIKQYYELLGFTLMDDAVLFSKDIL